MSNELTRRIARLKAAFQGDLTPTDLPEPHTDPLEYFTDGRGEWDDLAYAESLLAARGPKGPAWVALRELEELEQTLAALESRVRDRNPRDADAQAGEAWRASDRRASHRHTGTLVDARVFDSIRAQLVVLATLELESSETDH